MAISFLHRPTGAAPLASSPRRRCRTLLAGCRGSVPSPSSAFRRLPHFQSSMLLHNLSSVFSLGRKASQRARRGSRVPHQRPPRRARPQAHTKPHPAAAPHHVTPRSTVPHHAAPRPACPAPAPFPAAAGFPQRFPHFCRFPTAAFFPLGFLGERQRQIFCAVGSSCSVRHGMVRYCTVRLGTVPRDVASASRVTNLPERPPSTPGRTAGGQHRKPLRRLSFALPDLRYVNQFLPSVSNPGKWAISARQNGTKNFLSVFFARILWFPLQISAQKEPPFRAALRHVCVRFSARVTPG